MCEVSIRLKLAHGQLLVLVDALYELAERFKLHLRPALHECHQCGAQQPSQLQATYALHLAAYMHRCATKSSDIAESGSNANQGKTSPDLLMSDLGKQQLRRLSHQSYCLSARNTIHALL